MVMNYVIIITPLSNKSNIVILNNLINSRYKCMFTREIDYSILQKIYDLASHITVRHSRYLSIFSWEYYLPFTILQVKFFPRRDINFITWFNWIINPHLLILQTNLVIHTKAWQMVRYESQIKIFPFSTHPADCLCNSLNLANSSLKFENQQDDTFI